MTKEQFEEKLDTFADYHYDYLAYYSSTSDHALKRRDEIKAELLQWFDEVATNLATIIEKLEAKKLVIEDAGVAELADAPDSKS